MLNICRSGFPVSSEVLTRSGWKSPKDVEIGEDVMSFNVQTDRLEFVPIRSLVYWEDEVISMNNSLDSLFCTKHSLWYGWKRKWSKPGIERGKEYSFFRTSEISGEHNIITSAIYQGLGESVLPKEASLVSWILSDGYYKWSEKKEVTSSSHGKKRQLDASISQAIHKFTEEVEEALNSNNIRYSVGLKDMENGNHVKCYKLSSPDAREFFERVVGSREQKHEKNWCEWILKLDEETLATFVHSFWLADGLSADCHKKLGYVISQNDGNIQDAIALAMFLQGWKVTLNRVAQKGGKGICRTVRRQKKRHIGCQVMDRKSEGSQCVFGATNENNSIVIRQGRIMTIVGLEHEQH